MVTDNDLMILGLGQLIDEKIKQTKNFTTSKAREGHVDERAEFVKDIPKVIKMLNEIQGLNERLVQLYREEDLKHAPPPYGPGYPRGTK